MPPPSTPLPYMKGGAVGGGRNNTLALSPAQEFFCIIKLFYILKQAIHTINSFCHHASFAGLVPSQKFCWWEISFLMVKVFNRHESRSITRLHKFEIFIPNHQKNPNQYVYPPRQNCTLKIIIICKSAQIMPGSCFMNRLISFSIIFSHLLEHKAYPIYVSNQHSMVGCHIISKQTTEKWPIFQLLLEYQIMLVSNLSKPSNWNWKLLWKEWRDSSRHRNHWSSRTKWGFFFSPLCLM